MNTHTAPHRFSFDRPSSALRPIILERVPALGAALANSLERLAAWAERPPLHHRMGSFERFR